jgi:NTP pyrophosphatase (non-canonical NTP hydrolase)
VSNLTLSQIERLALLAEECGEVVQVVGKIMRFGFDGTHNQHSNRERLEVELGDLQVAIDMLAQANDIDLTNVQDHAVAKFSRIGQHLLHNDV